MSERDYLMECLQDAARTAHETLALLHAAKQEAERTHSTVVSLILAGDLMDNDGVLDAIDRAIRDHMAETPLRRS